MKSSFDSSGEASGPRPINAACVGVRGSKSRLHQRGVEHLFLFPGIERIALVPFVRKLDESPRCGCRFEQMERVQHDPGLSIPIKRLTGLVAEGKVHEDGAGRLDGDGDIEGGREHDGWNAGLLDGAGEQSHGLVTELSDRDQEGRINAHLPQPSDEVGRHLFLEPCPREDPPHEGKSNRGEFTDEPLDLQLPKPLEGEDCVEVFDVPGVLGVVRDFQVCQMCLFWDLPKCQVVLDRIERFLALVIDPPGADQGDPALPDRLDHWGPGTRQIDRPLVRRLVRVESPDLLDVRDRRHNRCALYYEIPRYTRDDPSG